MKRCSLNKRDLKQESPYLLGIGKDNEKSLLQTVTYIKMVNSSEVSNFSSPTN